MKNLKRYDIKNADYFITIVTYNRHNILHKDIDLFHDCWKNVSPKAYVILPDHFHVILNNGNNSISELIHGYKIKYSRLFRSKFGPGRVWQNRFWDHIIRDREDLNNHLDYIHYNPVKHGFVNNPFEYEYSSLEDYYDNGMYERNWGVEKEIEFDDEYGE
jgi:putative transposase